MKASPLLVAWHDENSPVYSVHFDPHGKGRLASAGGDHLVRVWRVETNGDERKIVYLSTLAKHTQAVNVVRWCPRGELLASAGDDGNVLLWTPTDNPSNPSSFDEEGQEDLEHWRVKTMCRSSSGSEIYDLAWSPDGMFFVTGSMDNVARIYNATTGQTVRQIAEHNHYVQGVAWDPLNEFLATQSSDRSVHIYALKTKDDKFSLNQHNKITKMDLPGRRVSSNSPAPPDPGNINSNHRSSFVQETLAEAIGSPRPSAPGTPQSLALPMNPPPTSHSRRSSFGSQMGHSVRQRSVSPSPSMPLPAVMPSASPSLTGGLALGPRNTNLYANETFTSFFRRLTFAPDGSLLFTPAGQYKTSGSLPADGSKPTDDTINTVYVYTRAGLNKPPVAYLPGHKKPSVAVRCSPVYYHIRATGTETKEIAIDTGAEDDLLPLPEPVMPSKPPTSHATMEPPPAPSPSPSAATMASPRPPPEAEPSPATANPPPGPPPAFGLPYRIVYAVATQDAVHVYDTQQQKPLCVVSNLHYATFTDLTWANDGETLLMSSSDGFCSALTFAPGELGTVYHHTTVGSSKQALPPISAAKANSASTTPVATPTTGSAQPAMPNLPFAPGHSRQASVSSNPGTSGGPTNPSPSPFTPLARPASPARSMSASSIGTESSFARVPDQNAPPAINNPTPSLSSVPSLAAAGSAVPSSSTPCNMPLFTPPQTPGHPTVPGSFNTGVGINALSSSSSSVQAAVGGKREHALSSTSKVESADPDETQTLEQGREKRRRIAPTPVSDTQSQPHPPAS